MLGAKIGLCMGLYTLQGDTREATDFLRPVTQTGHHGT